MRAVAALRVAFFGTLLVIAACDTTPTYVSALADSVPDGGTDFDAGADAAGTCGNDLVDLGEICDPSIDLCCNSTCDGVLNADSACRTPAGACDLPEFCDGLAAACPLDLFANEGVECRSDNGDLCDVAESCDGLSGACPLDLFAAVVCGDSRICGLETCDDGVGGSAEEFDGCDLSCNVEFGHVCAGEPSICDYTPAFAGELVITEIQKDPTAVLDAAGEWFEVFNPTELEFNLLGLEFANSSGEFFIIDQTLILPGNSHAVLGNNGNTGTNGNVTVDFVYSNFALQDEGTIVVSNLLEQVVIDQVAYDTTNYPSVPGSSLSLDPDFRFDDLGNDSGSNWCVATTAIGSGDFGTPGFENPFCQITPSNSSVADAFFLATGFHDFDIGAGSSIPLFVDGDHDGGGWVLVGRGRDGWAWSEDGSGTPDTVKDDIGTAAAFTPNYLSAALIQELIDNASPSIDLTLVEIRIKRASADDGGSYQESVWLPITQTTWTWLFDGGGPSGENTTPFGYEVDLFVFDSVLGTMASLIGANTEDTVDPFSSFGADDHTRIFTWAWDGHTLQQGFSYGTSVTIGDTSSTNFAYNEGMGRSLPYTEIYIRGGMGQ